MASAEVRTPARTETEIAADVVAVLLRGGVIPHRAEALRSACDAALVSVGLVQARFDRMGRGGFPYPVPAGRHLHLVADEPSPTTPTLRAKLDAAEGELTMLRSSITAARIAEAERERDEALADAEQLRLALGRLEGSKRPPARQQKATATRKARAGNEKIVDGVVMRRCSRGHWLPADPEHFYVKNVETGALTSMCHDHRREYQRARYFTVSKEKALNSVGVEFLIDEDDDVTGLSCTDCGRALKTGDRVAGHSSLHHVTCPKT